ncbi:MAG: hypothetical protein JETT_1468 [Candidatus Jettenia ecosi]|uniref:Uncharacterized protein n=1 Tax=Candidatus Jettenia ecosi TaxID=2494326 RepID=A0A533QBX4_9BACT|nr:MAG: hypothetical protein JETT_1468 [Candidatus Jettenia ecosi]
MPIHCDGTWTKKIQMEFLMKKRRNFGKIFHTYKIPVVTRRALPLQFRYI